MPTFKHLFPLLPLLFRITLAQADQPPAVFTIAFIDVGQGDAILLRDGAGFDVLIDGGRKSAGETVLAYLRREGVDDLEAIVATHSDLDHIGGLIGVLEDDEIPVEGAFYNGYPGDTQTWAEFVAAVDSENLILVPVQYPDSFDWGNASVSVLNPIESLGDPEQNAASVVLVIDYAQTSTILTADIDIPVENQLLGRVASLQAKILKVAHHGSKYSSGEDFLAAVQPAECVISVGPNAYGHPAPETLGRLKSTGSRLWRTDQSGTVTAMIGETGYTMLPRLTYLPLSLSGLTLP